MYPNRVKLCHYPNKKQAKFPIYLLHLPIMPNYAIYMVPVSKGQKYDLDIYYAFPNYGENLKWTKINPFSDAYPKNAGFAIIIRFTQEKAK